MGHGGLSIKPNWWIAEPGLVDDVRKTLVGPYATLALSVTPEAVSVQGMFPVVHDGEIFDQYEIKVGFPETYPDDPPNVRETAGRIPHIADRHNSSGVACLFVPFEWKLKRSDTQFETFLLGPVHSYFVGQSLVEAGQPWPFGERKHGLDGALQALRDMLGLSSDDHARAAILVLTNPQIKGHWDCPCGSGKRLRACHGPALWKMSTPNNVRWFREIVTAQVIATRTAEELAGLTKRPKQQRAR